MQGGPVGLGPRLKSLRVLRDQGVGFGVKSLGLYGLGSLRSHCKGHQGCNDYEIGKRRCCIQAMRM